MLLLVIFRPSHVGGGVVVGTSVGGDGQGGQGRQWIWSARLAPDLLSCWWQEVVGGGSRRVEVLGSMAKGQPLETAVAAL